MEKKKKSFVNIMHPFGKAIRAMDGCKTDLTLLSGHDFSITSAWTMLAVQ